jgi:hypothetical protein
MRRHPRNLPGRRPNPLRDIALDQRRALEAVRERARAEELKAEMPSLIEDHVGEHIQKLETKLLRDFKQMGQRAMDESAAVLNDQLADRIGALEQISSIQSRTIVNLRDSSKAAEQKVSSVVNSIERTLSVAVPGFQLPPAPASAYPQLQAAPQPTRAALQPDAEGDTGKAVFCPNCTSTNVRRAYRKGLWEQVLRLFFLAPYRCRACRHKFYRP